MFSYCLRDIQSLCNRDIMKHFRSKQQLYDPVLLDCCDKQCIVIQQGHHIDVLLHMYSSLMYP